MSDDTEQTIWWHRLLVADLLADRYGDWMALSRFVLFGASTMKPDYWAFWLLSQVAMLAGLIIACLTNWVLICNGIKERM